MSEPILMPYQSLPFNGDTYICQEFLKLKKEFNLNVALETGSCLYSTTKWLGENFERVYTVEINHDYAKHGYHKVKDMANVKTDISDSVFWLERVITTELKDEDRCIFFLDAHWGDFCPLQSELNKISLINTNQPPVIAIHDFYTGNEELGYDSYKGQPFVYEWLKPHFDYISHVTDCEYKHYYNTVAEGAKRGIIYLTPKI